jgi:hypothetical protein
MFNIVAARTRQSGGGLTTPLLVRVGGTGYAIPHPQSLRYTNLNLLTKSNASYHPTTSPLLPKQTVVLYGHTYNKVYALMVTL